MEWRRKLCGSLAPLVLLAACGGSARSTERFCKVLDEEHKILLGNAAKAGSSAGDQFLLLLSNVSEANRMVQRLNDAAPDEIAPDMAVVADAWKGQADTASKAAKDPLGASTAVLVTALLSSSSFNAVDSWSQSHCGAPVFALRSRSAGGGGQATTTTQPPCPWLAGSPASDLRTLVESSSPDGPKITGALAGIESNATGPAHEAAVTLRQGIEQLRPEPRYVREALGRLRWAGIDPVARLRDINDGVKTQCGIALLADKDLTLVAEAGPVPGPDGTATKVEQLFDRCSKPQPGPGPILIYSECASGQAVLNTRTGEVRWLDLPLTNGSRPRATIAGDRLVWMERRETQASGLNPKTFTNVLHILTLDGKASEVALASRNDHFAEADIAYARLDRIVVWVNLESDGRTSSLRVLDGSGTVVKEHQTERVTFNSSVQVSEHGLLLDSPYGSGEIVDVTTGAFVQTSKDYSVSVNVPRQPRACLNWGLAGGRSGPFPVRDDGTSITVGAPMALPNSTTLLPLRAAIVGDFEHGPAKALSPAGQTLWSIPENVVKDARAFGGWVVARNTSNQEVVVDPTTGKEASGLSQPLRKALDASGPNRYLAAFYDRPANQVHLASKDDYWSVPISELCPS